MQQRNSYSYAYASPATPWGNRPLGMGMGLAPGQGECPVQSKQKRKAEAGGDSDNATGGADDPATNHPAQWNLPGSSEFGGGESTEKKRRGSKPGSKTAKTHKDGGASFHSSAKAALNFSASLLNAGLADYEQTPDQTGHILFRTAAFSGTRKKGENCALGTLNFVIGDSSLVKVPDLTETSKKLYGEKEMPSFQIMTQTLDRKRLPFELRRLKKFGQGPIALHSLLNKTEGIFLLRCQVKSNGKVVGHFLGVDCWRRIIYDNDADETMRYCQWDESDMASPEAANDVFRQIGLVQLMQVCMVKVLASRRSETPYYGG